MWIPGYREKDMCKRLQTIIEIRFPRDRLIIIMGIFTLVIRHFCIITIPPCKRIPLITNFGLCNDSSPFGAEPLTQLVMTHCQFDLFPGVIIPFDYYSFIWCHHDMEMLSALLSLCEGNLSVTGRFIVRRTSNMKFKWFLPYNTIYWHAWRWNLD